MGERVYIGITIVDRKFVRDYDGPIKVRMGCHKLEIGKVEDLEVQRDPTGEPYLIVDKDCMRSIPLRDGSRFFTAGARGVNLGFKPDEQFQIGVLRTGDKITIVDLGNKPPIIAVPEPR